MFIIKTATVWSTLIAKPKTTLRIADGLTRTNLKLLSEKKVSLKTRVCDKREERRPNAYTINHFRGNNPIVAYINKKINC